ncbi:hypothetical protein [Microbacterium sp. BK668]|uniref:hypothetical protein n=1 Tax=Microbacterium sp. BK668 TaxID=2512118 RepID=UPI00105B5173|nr:hypothetical protein [Microbacterium sp. BK668]TDN88554.1 hypothetical protein EV279_2999 [Microbacterium sp. BK668]
MSRRRTRTTVALTAALVAAALTTGAGIASASPSAGSAGVVAGAAGTAIERAPEVRAPKPKATDMPESAAPAVPGRGWWKHVYAGRGKPRVDAATAQGYLDTVASRSSVFPEHTDASTPASAHAVLSPKGRDVRGRATAALLVAWLQWAGGAVAEDALVPLKSGELPLSELLSRAEEVVLDPSATPAQLRAVTRDLARVRHAT